MRSEDEGQGLGAAQSSELFGPLENLIQLDGDWQGAAEQSASDCTGCPGESALLFGLCPAE